jgi:hypothetical protein
VLSDPAAGMTQALYGDFSLVSGPFFLFIEGIFNMNRCSQFRFLQET